MREDNKVDESNKPDDEEEVTQEMEQELTDEQLLQMAEGSCTWGANCHG